MKLFVLIMQVAALFDLAAALLLLRLGNSYNHNLRGDRDETANGEDLF